MSQQTFRPKRGVTSSRAARGAWSLVALYVILATAGPILFFQPGMPPSPFYGRWEAVLQSAGILVMSVIGAFIVSRLPLPPYGRPWQRSNRRCI